MNMEEKRNVKRDFYKGNPVIILPIGNTVRDFSFGLAKARSILDHIDDIKAFVDEYKTEDKV